MQQAPVPCPRCSHSNRAIALFCGQCGAALDRARRLPPDFPLAEGSLIGPQKRYRVERLLSLGGFGEVYLAHDTTLRRECVIKRMYLSPRHGDPALQLRYFEHEALLLASLNTPGHPNIPEIYECLPAERCLVMKYIAGQSLHALISGRAEPLAEVVALRLVREVCAALAYMHGKEPEPVLHRDVKPDNILIGGDGRVWLVDFGLARGASLGERAERGAGTPGFAPPEQWRGQAEPRSDVYALALTLYALLTNYIPRDSALDALIRDSPPPLPPIAQLNPTVRPEVIRLVAWGSASAVAERPTAREFLAAIEVLLAQPEAPPPPEPLGPPSIAEFVGREAELAAYAERLRSEGLVILSGMAGVGKTSLAAALAVRAGAAEKLFWHSFRAGDGADRLAWSLAGLLWWNGQPELWALMHQARGAARPSPPELLLEYAARLVRGRGYLLCLDDMHLVEDDPLLGPLVERLVAAVRAGELRLIVTARAAPAFAPPDLPPLPGLDPGDALALMARYEVSLPPEAARALLRATGGNAQLLTLAASALRGAADPERLIGRLPTADHIADYLLRQVDRGLSAAERSVMAAVAVLLDHGGTRDAVEALLEGESAWRLLRSLRQRHLLVANDNAGDPVYAQHSIVRGFYYAALGRRERLTLHRRAAGYYEGEGADLLEAARHYAAAAEHGRAAELAAGQTWAAANRGEAHALRHLLDSLPLGQLDPEQRIATQLAQGELAALLSDGETAQLHYGAALALLEARPAGAEGLGRRARACRGMGEALQHEAPAEALAWLERGLALLDGGHPEEAAALQTRRAAVLIGAGDYDGALAAAAAGLGLLPAEAAEARADALTNLGAALCARGEVAAGLARYHEALALYAGLGSAWKQLAVWQNLGIEQVIAGDWDGGEASLEHALAEAERLGSIVRQTDLALSLGILHMRRGDLDAARGRLGASVALARAHSLREQLVAGLASLADLRLRAGSHDEAAPALEEAEDLARAIAAHDQLPEIHRVWAALLLARGEAAAALERAACAVAAAEELGLDLEHGTALRARGEALAAAGRAEEAAAAFAASVDLLAERDPYEAALARLAWGRALRDRGAGELADALLRQAAETLERLGVKGGV